ncbi:MAG: hypothetical protein HY644_12475 [Acidobacteria bacterium]|nr:hypothetical protein [Acidobacteriota bacterium]
MLESKLFPMVLLFVIFGFEFNLQNWLDAFSIDEWFDSISVEGKPIKIPA